MFRGVDIGVFHRVSILERELNRLLHIQLMIIFITGSALLQDVVSIRHRHSVDLLLALNLEQLSELKVKRI